MKIGHASIETIRVFDTLANGVSQFYRDVNVGVFFSSHNVHLAPDGFIQSEELDGPDIKYPVPFNGAFI